MRTEPEVAAFDPIQRHAWVALGVCSISSLMVGMSVTGLTLMFDTIAEDFGTSRSTLAWSLAGYSIVLAALLLPGGRMADRLGRLRVFRSGLAVFAIASIGCAIAPGIGLFTLARLGQAVGAALFLPASLALVLPEFPIARRNTAVAAWAATGYIGNGLAPSFTAIVGLATWRWLFVFFAVACGVVWFVAPRTLPDPSRERSENRVDLLGVPIGVIGVGMLALAIIEGPVLGWDDPVVIGAAIGACILLPAFIVRSLRHPEPLLDLRLFKARAVWSANVANVFLSSAGVSIWLVYALFLSRIWDWSVMKTGLALTFSPMCAGVAAILSARYAERLGERKVIEIGSMLPVAGTAWLVWRLSEDPNFLVDFLPGMLLFSFGFGLTFAPLNAAALNGVPEAALGQANAAFNTLRQLAGGLGTALMISILGNEDVIPISSFHTAFIVAAALTLLCAVVIAVWYPRHPSGQTALHARR